MRETIKYHVFKRWWMGVYDNKDNFVGFVTTNNYPNSKHAEVKRAVVKELRSKAKKLGYKTKGKINYG